MGKAQQLPGSHCWQRIKGVVRVCKAASKKPHSRSNTDISHIAAETQSVKLLTRDGAAVHRELCHVLQTLSVSQMQSVRLPGEFKSSIMVYVLQGRVQIRTRSRAAFEHGLECSTIDGAADISSLSSPGSSSAGSPGASSTSRGSSSAIDVEELQYALSVTGINKLPAEVQELMDSVDKDGSGQLEFEEFVLILTTKLGVGGRQREPAWQQLPDGSWTMEVEQGGCFGEAALLKGLVRPQRRLLPAHTGHGIIHLHLTRGFDGQLNAKIGILKSSSVLASCISSRSDMRGLAYAAASESMAWAGRLYAAGQAATALPRSRLAERRVELALLGTGDIAGEASALGQGCHASSAVVCSAHALVLRLDLQDLRQLLHPSDMQHLAELLQLRDEERQQRLQAAAALPAQCFSSSSMSRRQQGAPAEALQVLALLWKHQMKQKCLLFMQAEVIRPAVPAEAGKSQLCPVLVLKGRAGLSCHCQQQQV
ncbi:hypothetical protein COO60DRAFT_1643534 [Scenedesmus sp. NREL 46B-D3]|nr:hypothetical protein COO60DRAFT_1643534 [Scenedesmus sp. NREL 46B-D3]